MISVVIPSYNRQLELSRALQSLADQTVKDFEVLVCDDGSIEDVEFVVNSFKPVLNIHYFQSEHTGGPSKSTNKGIKHATGEWISLLDSDDWWAPNRIEIISSYLSEDVDLLYHPLRIVYSKNCNRFSGFNFLTKNKGRAIDGDPISDMLSRGNPIPNSSAVIRKTCLAEIGGYVEVENGSLATHQDFDTWLTLATHGARFLFVNRCLGFYWIGKDNISEVSDKQLDRQIFLFKRHCLNLPNDLEAWAKSYNNYMIGTYLLKLGRAKEALVILGDADRLRYRHQKLFRVVKMFIAMFKIIFTKNILYVRN